MNKAHIRIILIYAVFLFTLSILQFSLPAYISILDVRPDLLFVFSVLVGYLYGTVDAVFIGLLAGFVRDSYSGRFLGLSMLICMFCGIIASLFLKKILNRNILLAMVQVVSASVLYTIYLTVVSVVFFAVPHPLVQYFTWLVQNQLIPSIIMNIIVSIILYFILKKFGPYNIKRISLISNDNKTGDSLWN